MANETDGKPEDIDQVGDSAVKKTVPSLAQPLPPGSGPRDAAGLRVQRAKRLIKPRPR